MNIFLTGGTGFVGKNFIQLAISNGHNIIAVSRKKKINKKNVKWLTGSLDKSLPRYFKKIDVLVHLAAAGVNKDKNPKEIIKTNIFDSSKLILNAIKCGCKKFLIISSSSEYGNKSPQKFKKLSLKSKRNPLDLYGKSKVIFSDFCKMIAKKKKIQVKV